MLLCDDDDEHLAARCSEGEAMRATLMRATACRRLHRMDLKAKYKRALKRRSVRRSAPTFRVPGYTSGSPLWARGGSARTQVRGRGQPRSCTRIRAAMATTSSAGAEECFWCHAPQCIDGILIETFSISLFSFYNTPTNALKIILMTQKLGTETSH